MENVNKVSSNFQEKLSDKISGYFDNVVDVKSKFYSMYPNKKPKMNEAKSIITSYSYKNAAISGGLSLIPGPLGLVAALPEIALVIKNQIDMIYDIGISMGKESKLKPELLMYIFANALGSATGSLALMHGSKLVLKRASLSLMQKIIKAMAGRITQNILKSMVAKWLPIAGAIIMATWSKFSTQMIGNKAIEILSKDIELEEESVESFEENDLKDGFVSYNEVSSSNEIDFQKVLLYIALINSDNKLDREEYKYIKPIIADKAFSTEQQQKLMDTLNKRVKNDFNLNIIKQNPSEVYPTIFELLSISKLDGNIHPLEKEFITKIAFELNIENDVINHLFDEIPLYNNTDSNNNSNDSIEYTENDYIEEFNIFIEDGSDISEKERKLLNRKREKLGISEERAKEIEDSILNKNQFTQEELDFIEEVNFCLEDDGEIDESEMKMLKRKSVKLGLSEERAQEIINHVLSKQRKL